MFSNIEELSKLLLRVHQTSRVSIKRDLLNSLCDKYKFEMSIILSLMYNSNRHSFTINKIQKELTLDDNWQTIFGNFVYYDEYNNIDFIPYLKSLPYEWQLILHIIGHKRIITSVGENYMFSVVDEFYLKDKLISFFTLPNVLPDTYEYQSIKRGVCEVITFPITAYGGGDIKQLKYLLNYGTKVISNVKGKVRRDILKKFGIGRYGLIFIVYKVQGYKYKKSFKVLFKGDLEDILSLYTGKPFDYTNIEPLGKEYAIINNKDELLNVVKSHIRKIPILYNKNGIYQARLITSYELLPCLDYITDDDYSPIGIVTRYLDKEYKIYFNLTNTHLMDTITNKYIKCMIRSLEDMVIDIKFNSVVPQWSNKHTECVYCGSTKYRHNSKGLCNHCYYMLKNNVLTGNIKPIQTKTKPFSVVIKDIDCSYQISGGGEYVTYKLVSGQGKLELPV